MTHEEMVITVLQNLTVLEEGETPSPDDSNVIMKRYPQVWQMLNTEGLTNWAVDQDIPENMALPFCDVMAAHCWRPFREDAVNTERKGMYDLRRQIEQRTPYQPVRFVDF